MKQDVVIVWLKRDLRLHDHAPFYEASRLGVPVLPLYVVEPEYWAQPFASRRHWYFIHDCLMELREDCTALGQPLVVRAERVIDVFTHLSNTYNIGSIYTHEETGNGWTYERDKAVIKWCVAQNIELHEYPHNGVVRRLKSRDDWSKIRNARMAQDLMPKPNNLIPVPQIDIGDIPSKDHPMFGDDINGITQTGGRRAGIETLRTFLSDRGRGYLYNISKPDKSPVHSSRLSPFLAWGVLSVRECLRSTQNRRKDLSDEEAKQWKRNLSAFSSRLSWRCHFIQKIEDQPDIEFKCMHPAFEDMRENEHNEEYYQAWANGYTGYPLIDACMRYLAYNGWITFRMRAMLISFASYHLWLDWRKTGYHLARLFTDYEPGIHYSQLQMQSGVTGINAIRIYNPIKQSQDHDPNGNFIREWVHELRGVSNAWIHEPWLMDENMQAAVGCVIGMDYPAPIVDHKTAVKLAREKMSKYRKTDDFYEQSLNVYDKLGSRKRPSNRRSKTKPQSSKQLSLL